MKLTNFYTGLAFVGLFAFLFLMFAALTQTAKSTADVPVTPYNYKLPVTLLNATTTSATSTNISGGGGYLTVAGAKKVVMYFQRGGVSNLNLGTSTFKVQGSPDGAEPWYDFGLFAATATSSVPNLVRYGLTNVVVLGTGTGNGTSTIPLALDLTNFSFYALRVIVVETVDGEHTVKATAEF